MLSYYATPHSDMERNCLTANGSELSSSVFMPSKVAVIHYKGHQKRVDEMSQDNQLTYIAAQKASQGP